MFYDQKNRLLSYLNEDDFKNKKVLELGCGAGQYSSAAKNMGAEVFATEFNKDLCTVAKENVGDNFTVYNHDNNFPMDFFEDNMFDTILLPWVITHIKDEKLLLSELKRVLKSGGKVLLCDNSFSFPIERMITRKSPKFLMLYPLYVVKKLFDKKLMSYDIYSENDFYNIAQKMDTKVLTFKSYKRYGLSMNICMVAQKN